MKTTLTSRLIFMFFCFSVKVFAQDSVEFTITILNPYHITSVSFEDGEYVIEFKQTDITNIFADYTITKFEQTYPQSRFDDLRKIWSIQTNDIGLMYILVEDYNSVFRNGQLSPELIPTYTPNDYIGVYPNRNDLDLINVRDAWNISKGNTSVRIGINDTGIDTSTTDFVGQIFKVWSNSSYNGHGTAVASIVGSKVDNNFGLTGVGFDCKIDFSVSGTNNILTMSNDGVRVVNASWLSGDCSGNLSEEILYNEIYENGTTACFGAGNGIQLNNDGSVKRHDCYLSKAYPPSYPHNMSTTSVGCENNRGDSSTHWLFGYTEWGWKDVHWHIHGAYDTVTKALPWFPQFPVGYTFPREMHNHNEDVDIAAPGYTVRVITPGNNYFGTSKGTSFASPMTAGTAGLMLSANSCLSPYQIEYGIKTTAANIDTIPENIPYVGKLGAGRLDAGAAVSWASTFNCNDSVASTMYIEGIEINTICQPGQSSNNVLPQLTPIIKNGTPPYTYLWRGLDFNETTLDSSTSNSPQIMTSTGNHIAHYYLLIEDSSPIKKAAGRIIKIQLTNAQTYDLAMRDSYMDMLGEPNQQYNVDPRDWSVWLSPDLWNRKTQDSVLIHEHPEYFTSNPNYAYARVRNVGCTANPTGKKLRLYWSKASTGEDWDEDWTTIDLTGSDGNPVAGGREITTNPINIPELQPGEQFITNHTWYPIQPIAYDSSINSVDVCFLARIEDDSVSPYGITFPEDSIIKHNVFNNNNIVTRNFVVTDYKTGNNRHRHQILVGNAGEETAVFDFEVIGERAIHPHFSGDLSALGTVTLYLDDLFDDWSNGGYQGNYSSISEVEKSVSFDMSEVGRLEGLSFSGKERVPIIVELDGANNSKIDQQFHIRQLDHEDNSNIYGNVTFFVESILGGGYRSQNFRDLEEETPSKLGYLLYPNPNKGTFFIEYRGENNKNIVQLGIFDLSGRLLMEQNNIALLPSQKQQINTQDLNSGLYFIHLTHKDGTKEILKFIKE